MTPPSLDFYALTFALFKAGAVVVLIDPGMGLKRLGVCLREVEPEAFIGVPKPTWRESFSAGAAAPFAIASPSACASAGAAARGTGA